MTHPVFKEIANRTAARYKPGGRFAMGFARGKLLGDPAFEFLIQSGQLRHSQKILDLGCGQGLLTALLTECSETHARGDWPADWPAPPRAEVHGIELMAADVHRAHAALGPQASFEVGNIALTAFAPCDTVVILDVLHYLNFDEQRDILQRIRSALAPSGQLLLRIGDADGGLGFRWSNWVDHVVTWCRGHRLPKLYCRSVTEWLELLEASGFNAEKKPLSEGTLFANVLLIGNTDGTPPVRNNS
ncbi:MAG: class I SAM-dependent methyltransferase [Burkholderiaceae bacterium]